MLAVAASQQLDGDPVWLLMVAAPGAAKTEQVQTLAGAGAHVTSTITSEGALLSASPKRGKTAKTATGGLLRKIGSEGILVIKDVTSILSSSRVSRATVLAALREIYDGRWERNVGNEGGDLDLDRAHYRDRSGDHGLGCPSRRGGGDGRPVRPGTDRTRRKPPGVWRPGSER